MENKQRSDISNEDQASDKQQKDERGGTGIFNVIKSVFAAILGVQSDQNRDRDFKQGNATDYIIVGVIAVIALVVGMIIIVNSVISNAQ